MTDRVPEISHLNKSCHKNIFHALKVNISTSNNYKATQSSVIFACIWFKFF